MKKTIQKTVSFVLVFLMVFSCLTVLPTEVFHSLAARAAELVTSVTGADETYTSGDYTYTLINEYTEVNITGYSGSETELKLPSELDGKRVSAVGNGAFRSFTRFYLGSNLSIDGCCQFFPRMLMAFFRTSRAS